MEEEFHFGPYVLRVSKRAVLMNGQPIPLGSRATDILIYLVRHAGELQSNAAIIKNSWPDTYVDEANLRVHISALRRALGDTRREPRFIANVPGRGYSFIGPLSSHVASQPLLAEPGHERSLSSPELIGRAQAIASLADQLAAARLLTITGPGGIGKSAIARALVERFGQKYLWVDLAEVDKDSSLVQLVAAEVDLGHRSDDAVAAVAARLNERGLLLVLDSCEHVVDAAADLAEKLSLFPGPMRILATSREPLRARGERVHRISPLDLPDLGASEDGSSLVRTAMESPAVRLFVDRADACLGGYALTEEDAPFVAEICARLDGIPLAIELAAARLETMGIVALAASLSEGFRVLSRGTRTALPRHRTLQATLDWSYSLLSDEEQRTLQELSLLRGWFTTDLAAHLSLAQDVELVLDDLVSKSLVVADPKGRRTRFRLLDTTRLYAAGKLDESGRTPQVLANAARSLTRLLAAAEEEMLSVPLEEWHHDYAQHLPSVRLAASWAFGDEGDAEAGVDLVIAALPLFLRLTLMEECTRWGTEALARMDAVTGDPVKLMKLHAALGWPAMRSVNGSDKGIGAWGRVLRIAEAIGNVDYQLRAVWALWVDAITSAEPRRALEIAQRFSAIAETSADPVDAVVAKRLTGTTLHWLGRHGQARDLLIGMLAELRGVATGTAVGRYHLDQAVTARITLARCHWLLGEPDAAFAEVETAINEALALKHEVSLTHVLAEAGCPLALLDGRLDLAREYISLLLDHTEALSLDLWQTYARCFEAEIAIREGRAAEGLPVLCAGLRELGQAGFNNFRSGFLLAEARGMAQLGQASQALGLIEDALAACDRSGERWCVPELLRERARIILDQGGRGATERAREGLQQALEQARADGAVAWETAIAADLAALCPPTRIDRVSMRPLPARGRVRPLH